MKRTKKLLSMVLAFSLTLFTLISYLPMGTAYAKDNVPKIKFVTQPKAQYTVGERITFNISAPNYGGKVQYRAVLWNDTKKSSEDMWNSSNGYPSRYYTKWQPHGSKVFTFSWIINEPGTYRITVYAKRAGIGNNKTALKGKNSDSYIESDSFVVLPKAAAVSSILPLNDVTVRQGEKPSLPSKVKALLNNGSQIELKVTWDKVDTSKIGVFTLEGKVEGTTKKAYLKLIVTSLITLNIHNVTSLNNNLVSITLKDGINYTPEASRFSLKNFDNQPVSIQSVSLLSDKKTLLLSTGYMSINSWYSLTVDNKVYNFIAAQGSNIILSAQNKEVAVGSSVQSEVIKYPSDVTLYYLSNNPNIASVNQSTGLITGVSAGKATITVYASKPEYSMISTTFTVTVSGQNGMYVNAQNMELEVGTQGVPQIAKYPEDMTLYFASNNNNIATVNINTGVVTGVSTGTATITIYGVRAGYAGINTTFTVKVREQSLAISAYPGILKESTSNDGSLESGVLAVTLNSGSFIPWDLDHYVLVNNLPYGMSYTVTPINSTKLSVTITGKAVSHTNDININITLLKDAVYGATKNLITNNVLLDFNYGTAPAAPTNPLVNDIANSFGWTVVPGYNSYSYYEYSTNKGVTWRNSTANPQPVGDYNFPAGTVQVRLKATGDAPAGSVLVSDKQFLQVETVLYDNGYGFDAKNIGTKLTGVTATPLGDKVTFYGQLRITELDKNYRKPNHPDYDWAENLAWITFYVLVPDGATHVYSPTSTVPGGLVVLNSGHPDGEVVNINGARYLRVVGQFANKVNGKWTVTEGSAIDGKSVFNILFGKMVNGAFTQLGDVITLTYVYDSTFKVEKLQ